MLPPLAILMAAAKTVKVATADSRHEVRQDVWLHHHR
jgi:hypothetical protein